MGAQELAEIFSDKEKFSIYRQVQNEMGETLRIQFPTRMMIEWDELRCKINPHAPLSKAQKLMQEMLR